MAEYNPSKIIKDGNTYNFRDTTKIPLAGSNAISGSLIPSTDGTVNLGGPSYQWNNAYIKSLTINGVACGDILTHNASEFVPRSGGAVLTGTIFSRNDTTSSLVFRSGPNYADGASIQLKGKDQADASGGRVYINAHNGTASTTLTIWPTGEVIFSGALELKPSAGNSCNLGTSTNKWKSINGIAPDELGLPTSAYTDVSSYITNSDSTPNTFTAPVSGLLFLEGSTADSVNGALFNITKGYKMNCPWAYTNVRGFIPVEKGDSIECYISAPINLSQARIYHLKGKI